nr:MAG: ORF1 [Torque teno midi virus]
MPFWWRRRRRPWYPIRRFRRYYKTRKTTRRRRRRKYRRPFGRRRRRRRKYKVRRKKQKINLTQWQPDKIRKCKIKGTGYLIAGAEGNQYRCYTDAKLEYTRPKAPGGGSFGCETFSLEYLFNEWEAHRNIWTASNDYLDLVRYTGCKFTFFPHQTTDFVVSYDRQPPFTFDKDTYLNCHPQNLLLSRHKKVIHSINSRPGRVKPITLKIKPPKQMTTKWFFQKDFADYKLLKLQGAAVNFPYSLYGPNTQSPNITISALNVQFYKTHNWAQTLSSAYLPYPEYPTTTAVTYTTADKKTKSITVSDYKSSISYDNGFFNPIVLQAVEVKNNSTPIHNKPVAYGRYNPLDDTGQGNRVWLTSVISNKSWQTPADSDLIIVEEPLYIALYGIWDYMVRKKNEDYLLTSMFVLQSPAIKIVSGTEQPVWPILSMSFIKGQNPYDRPLTQQDKSQWYPNAYKQMEAINLIVESSQFVPKYYNLPSSTWQLSYKYTFYFKWGGQQISDNIVQDPKEQQTYPVPDKLFKTVQVTNPRKQSPQAILRSWDFRRDLVTRSAFKRMQENLSITESDQSDFPETPKKKRKVTSQIPLKDEEAEEVHTCFQKLFETDSYPEETQDLKQLIYKQYQHQQQLKQNLYKLLSNMKLKQKHLQMLTGLS